MKQEGRGDLGDVPETWILSALSDKMKTKHKSTLGSRVQMLSGDRLKPKEDAVSLV